MQVLQADYFFIKRLILKHTKKATNLHCSNATNSHEISLFSGNKNKQWLGQQKFRIFLRFFMYCRKVFVLVYKIINVWKVKFRLGWKTKRIVIYCYGCTITTVGFIASINRLSALLWSVTLAKYCWKSNPGL